MGARVPIETGSTVRELIRLLLARGAPFDAQVRGSVVVWDHDNPVLIIALAPEYEREPLEVPAASEGIVFDSDDPEDIVRWLHDEEVPMSGIPMHGPREISGQVTPLDTATRIVATPTDHGLELELPDILAGVTITLDVSATDHLIRAAGEAWELMGH